MQRVLTIPSDSVNHLYEYSAFYADPERIMSALNAIKTLGKLVERDVAEKDPSLRQIVACAVVRSESGLLCLRRSRNADRPALRLRYTMLVGGHVDACDLDHGESLVNCLSRELKEELGVHAPLRPPLLGVVSDPSNLVGWLHLGIVFDVIIRRNVIELAGEHDTSEFVHARKRQAVELMPFSEIRKIAHRLDPWSSLFITSRPGQELLGQSPRASRYRQRFLPFA